MDIFVFLTASWESVHYEQERNGNYEKTVFISGVVFVHGGGDGASHNNNGAGIYERSYTRRGCVLGAKQNRNSG